MSGLQACGQKTSAEDRILRKVQRWLVQSPIPIAVVNSPAIGTEAPVGRKVKGLNHRVNCRLQINWLKSDSALPPSTKAEAALQTSRDSNEDSSGISDC